MLSSFTRNIAFGSASTTSPSSSTFSSFGIDQHAISRHRGRARAAPCGLTCAAQRGLRRAAQYELVMLYAGPAGAWGVAVAAAVPTAVAARAAAVAAATVAAATVAARATAVAARATAVAARATAVATS